MSLSLVQILTLGWVLGILLAVRACYRARFPRKQ